MPLGTVKRREGLFIAQGETLRHGRGHGECRVEQHKYFVFMMNILRVTTLTTPHCGLPAARVLVSRDWQPRLMEKWTSRNILPNVFSL